MVRVLYQSPSIAPSSRRITFKQLGNSSLNFNRTNYHRLAISVITMKHLSLTLYATILVLLVALLHVQGIALSLGMQQIIIL